MLAAIEQRRSEVEALCRRYGVRRLDVFGSALRGDFDPAASDLDFVVEFDRLTPADASHRYFGLLIGLEDLFGRRIDLVSYTGIRNPYFRATVDRTRVPLYAA